jgi:hypothetical protein
LARHSSTDLESLYVRISSGLRAAGEGPAAFSARLIDAGFAELWQLPVVFAVGLGIPVAEMQALVASLLELSPGAIDLHACHIMRALNPPEGGLTPRAG